MLNHIVGESMYLLVCLEYDSNNDGHVALSKQLEQISKSIGTSVDVVWKDPIASAAEVSQADAVIVPNGPAPSFEGQILCCEKARELRIPFLGICGGLQAAAVDVARNLAHLPEANSEEYSPGTPVPLVHNNGKPCNRTPQSIRLVPGRYLAKLYGSESIEGIVRCGLFVNQEYWMQLEQAGLELLATSSDEGRIIAFRLNDHPFYVGVACLPQLSPPEEGPEPLLKDFLLEASGAAPLRSCTKGSFRIRNAREKDISHILQLWKKYGEYHSWLDTPEAVTSRLERERDLFLIAEIEGEIVASVMGSYDGRFAFAARLVVVPDYRRKGIATRLMQELETRLRGKGASQVSLLIEDNNDPAISLYNKRKYKLQEDVSYMRKRLS